MNIANTHSSTTDREQNWNSLLIVLASGGIAEFVLEFFAWWIVPAVLGRPMRPDILVADVAREVLNVDMSVVLGASIHLILGFFVFPMLFVVGRSVLNFRRPLIAATVYGVVLWAIAQSVLAPLAGRPMFLGFVAYTWASLIGHVLYAVVLGHVNSRLAQAH